MFTVHKLLTAALLLAAATLPLACGAATKAGSMEREGSGLLLDDLSMLRPGKQNEAVWVYKKTDVDWSRYTKVLIDPVIFQSPEGASQDEQSDLQKLAGNLHKHLMDELGQELELVRDAGPGTIRVQTAFYNPEKKSAAHIVSSIIPVGVVVSLTKDFITGKPLAVGEISGEAKVTDSLTGELLGAGLDRRVGTQYGEGMTDSWAEANEAVRFWAQRMNYSVCLLRHGDDGACVAPVP